MDRQTETRARLSKEVQRVFFVPFEEKTGFFTDLDAAIAQAPPTFSSIAAAFKQNLQAVICTISIPTVLAMASVQEGKFQRIHIAERIRALPIDPSEELSDSGEQRAFEEARRKMGQLLESEEGIKELADQACYFLLHTLNDRGVQLAAGELLRQGTVLVWGTFEVLVRDLFVAYVNANPFHAVRLIEDPVTRRKFQLKGISLEVLAEHDFNVSETMGSILVGVHDLGDLGSIKDILGTLFPDNQDLGNALDHRDLWILNQRRHLIVHRRGVVDARYVHNTGEQLESESVLTISPQDIERYLFLVRDAGVAILSIAAKASTTES